MNLNINFALLNLIDFGLVVLNIFLRSSIKIVEGFGENQ